MKIFLQNINRKANIFLNPSINTLFVVCFFLVSLNTFGQTSIWTNPITGADPAIAANPYTSGQTVNSLITVSGIGHSVALSALSSTNNYNIGDWSTSATINTAQYFSFTITPSSGYKVSMNNFVYTGTSGSKAPTSFAFRSNANGNNFSTNIGTPTAASATISLTGGSYQDLSSATSFRFYGFNSTSGSATTRSYAINDFTFNGSVLGSATTALNFGAVNTYGSTPVQTFQVNGNGLNPTNATITINGSTNYEVSTTSASAGFGAIATLSAASGSLSGANVWVRLKATTAIGNYNENITFGGGGVTGITIACNGTVTTRNLTISGVSANNKIYNGLTSATLSGTAIYSGLQNGESFSVTGTPSANFNTSAVGTSKPVTVTGYTSPNANYTVTQPILTANISVAALTITANNNTKIYGITQSSPISGSSAFGSTGLQNGETIGAVSLTYGSGALNATDAVGSTSTITPSTATGGSFTASNYSITYSNGTLTVTVAPLTITANNSSKVYGATQSTPVSGSSAFTSSGLQNGETFGTVTLTYGNGALAASDSVGNTSTITASSPTGGTFNASNYSITYTNGTLTVTAAPLTITANNGSKIYGQTYTVGSGSTAFTSSGLQNSETIGTITISSAGAVANAAVGIYGITPSVATGGTFNASNYSITYTNGTLTVTAAPLIIIADNGSKCFGITYTLGTTAFTSSGLLLGENIGSVILTSSGANSSAAVGFYDIVASAASGGTFTASNYNISYENGLLTVFALPNAPTGTNGALCSPGIVNISASVNVGETVDWYDTSFGGTLLVSGSTSFTTPSITSTTIYYAETRNTTTGCVSSTRTLVTATVYSTFTAGEIYTTGETICYNVDPSLAIGSLTNASGGDNAITYKWQANGVDIPSTNSPTFDPPSGLLVTTTYTRFAKDNTCNTTFTLSSGSWLITVTPVSNGGTVSGGTSICSGSTSGILTLSGQTGNVVRWESLVSPFTVWTTINNTTNTYTSDVLTETTHFRAVVQNGDCTEAVSTSTTVTVGVTKTYTGGSWNPSAPTSIDTAIIADTFISAGGGAGSFSACALTVNTGVTVVISSGDAVTLSGALTATAGSFVTFNNNASLIQSGTSNSNSGPIIIKRNSSDLMRLDYTLWSSPVANQNLFGFSPLTITNRFYTYNQTSDVYTTNDMYQMVPSPLTSSSTFQTGKGYLIRMPNNHSTTPTPWTGQFTGVPNSGTISTALTTVGAGFNLVGNPYPSPISIASFLSNNSSLIESSLWFWRKTNAALGSAYITYTAGTFNSGPNASLTPLDPQPNDYIQPGQGFFVKATSAGSLQFNNTQRSSTNGSFFRTNTLTAIPGEGRLWLYLKSNNSVVGNLAVGYKNGASNELDSLLDGKYINDSSLALTSFVQGQELSVQHRAIPFVNTDVVPLSFKTDLAASYSIAINAVDGIFLNGQTIYLRDNLTGIVHDLNASAYTFTSATGIFTSRFEIIYQSTLAIDTPNFNSNQVVVYKNQDKDFVINSGSAVMATVKLYDIRGRLLLEKKNINASETIIDGSNANEVLLIQITSEDGIIVTKKVIR